MNFLLKNLEQELDEQHLLVGEKLLDENRVTRLFESERHLWIARVDQFEVELQISPSRIRACSCECPAFQRIKMCGHVAAGLLALRRKLSDKTVKTEKKTQKTPAVYQKLTVNSILNAVSHDELSAFVRQFAQSNRNFTIALKAKFASRVPMPDSREKYAQLLDAAIQGSRKNNSHLSASTANHLLNVIKELHGQADDALALEHYAESWAILVAVVEKLTPVLRKIDGNNEAFIEYVRSCFDKITVLTEHPLAPALRQEIWHFLLTEFNRPAYRLNELSGLFTELMLRMANDPEKTKILLEAVEQELVKPWLTGPQRYPYLKTKILLLERKELKKAAAEFALECLSSSAKILEIVNVAEATGILSNIRPLAEKGLRFIEDAAVKSRLEAVLLLIAQGHGDQKTVVQLSRKHLLETGDLAFFEKCKAHFEGDWQVFVQEILADLIRLPRFAEHIGTIATILGREGRQEELLKLLDNQQSLELLFGFDHFLLNTHPREVTALYDQLLKTYLSDHLGLQAARTLRSVLHHLQQSGAPGLADQLAVSIRQAFPNRAFLFEELEVF